MSDFRPWALDILTTPDAAFDLADQLGMSDDYIHAHPLPATPLGVSLFDAPNGQMRVQALYETQADAVATQSALGVDATITQLPETDWVSVTQAGLPPVHAGRFFLYGSHDADKIPAEAVGILIDAGMAFGTGHHGTTAGCLRIFDQLLTVGQTAASVLDLGCGAGVLAIAAAKSLPASSRILATDIDPDAIEVTDSNAALNRVTARISAHVADGFDSPALRGETFDLIFANILAGPLMGLAPDIAAACAANGHVILSGILDEKAALVGAAFDAVGFHITPQPSLDGWTSLLGVKRA